jgi:hypothetical protein
MSRIVVARDALCNEQQLSAVSPVLPAQRQCVRTRNLRQNKVLFLAQANGRLGVLDK